jgi:gliding motility-associated-like protein
LILTRKINIFTGPKTPFINLSKSMYATIARSARAIILLFILLLQASTCLFARQTTRPSTPQPAGQPAQQPSMLPTQLPSGQNSLAQAPITRISSNTGDHLARLEKLAARIMRRIATSSYNTNTGPRITITSHTISPGQLLPGTQKNAPSGHTMPDNSAARPQRNPIIVLGTFTLTLDPTNTTCGYSNGQIVANAIGGTPPYQYVLLQNTNPPQPPNPPQLNNYFANLAAGSYTIYVTDAGNQIASANITLTNTYAPPALSIVSSTPVTGCAGTNASVTLGANGGTPPYLYSKDGTNFQASNVFSNLSAGDYIMYVRDANGCTATQPFISNINPQSCHLSISIGFSNGQEVCQNDGYLQISDIYGGSPPFQYSIGGPYQYSNTFNNLTAGLYTISVKDITGNVVLVYTIGLYEACPVYVSAVATDADCGVNNGTITATGSSGTPPYQYALVTGLQTVPGTGPFQSSNIFPNRGPGPYTITIVDFNDVTNFATVIVGGGCPAVNAVSANATCGLNNGSITATGSGGFPPYQYALYQNGSVLVPFQTSNTFPGLAPGNNYSVYIQDNKNVQRLTPVTVLATPDPLTISAGPGAIICQGNSFQLNGSTNGDTLYWLPTTGLNNPLIRNPIATPPTTTKYYLRSSLGPCPAIDSVTITVLPAPVADAGKDTSICLGTSVQLSGSGGSNYSWTPTTWLDDPNIGNPVSMSPTRTVIYSLTVMDDNGCLSLNTSSVKITVQPGVIYAGNDTSIAIGQPLQLFALDPSNNSLSQYIWTPSIYLNNPNTSTPIATFGQTGVYSYTVNSIAQNGCESQGQIVIKVYLAPDIFIPNAFTPNGDGHNDILRVIPAGIKVFKYMAVFNRWGQKVFYTSNPGEGWDGTFNGTPQQGGTYIWTAEAIDFEGHTIQRKGSVILIR